MTIQHVQKFFRERPQLTAHGFAIEAGISPRLLAYVLKEEKSLTKRTINKLLPIMIKYGYTE